jgi:hypothetical protein
MLAVGTMIHPTVSVGIMATARGMNDQGSMFVTPK